MHLGDVSDPIRVLVVDDHQMFSDVLSLLLREREGIKMIGAASGAEEALELCKRERPDVVLMDLDLPGMDGIEATREVRVACPEAKVIVLTGLQSHAVIASALAAGASGFVPKTRAVEDLIDIVRRAAAGEIVMPAGDLPHVLEELRSGSEPRPVEEVALARLTRRETEILRRLASGESTAAIAETLGISPLTVQSHVKSILAKLGVHSKIEAVTMAWRHGVAHAFRSA
ncbi:MAG: response regulator [Actinomycetota bacterium]